MSPEEVEAILTPLRAAHPRGVRDFLLESESGAPARLVVFRKIDKAAWTQFKLHIGQTQNGGPAAGRANELLARDLIIYPAGSDGQALIDQLAEDAMIPLEEIGEALAGDATGGLKVTPGKR